MSLIVECLGRLQTRFTTTIVQLFVRNSPCSDFNHVGVCRHRPKRCINSRSKNMEESRQPEMIVCVMYCIVFHCKLIDCRSYTPSFGPHSHHPAQISTQADALHIVDKKNGRNRSVGSDRYVWGVCYLQDILFPSIRWWNNLKAMRRSASRICLLDAAAIRADSQLLL